MQSMIFGCYSTRLLLTTKGNPVIPLTHEVGAQTRQAQTGKDFSESLEM